MQFIVKKTNTHDMCSDKSNANNIYVKIYISNTQMLISNHADAPLNCSHLKDERGGQWLDALLK